MSASNWFVALGLGLCAAALGGMAYRHETAPPAPPPRVELSCPAPVVNVAAPKPYICTPAQAEAGECLPLVQPAAPVLAHAHVAGVRAPTRAHTRARVKKPVTAKSILKSQWSK